MGDDGGGGGAEGSAVVSLTDQNIHQAVSLWFRNRLRCEELHGPITTWDTSSVTDMSKLFLNRADFNEDIGDWDVSRVQDMSHMFDNARSFHQDLNRWQVGQVEDMTNMFAMARSFNGEVSRWQTGKVESMGSMFFAALSFNQPVGEWDVSNVRDMHGVFNHASSFNQDVGKWNTSRAYTMSSMFGYATAFNQDISAWEVGKVVIMQSAFCGASSFYQDISQWEMHCSLDAENIFRGATAMQSLFASLGIWSLFEEKFRSMSLSERQKAFMTSAITDSEENTPVVHVDIELRRKNNLYVWLETEVFCDKLHLVDPIFDKLKEEESVSSLELLLLVTEDYDTKYLEETLEFSPAVASRIVEELWRLEEKERLKKEAAGIVHTVIPQSAVETGRCIGKGIFGDVFEGVYQSKRVALKVFGVLGFLRETGVLEARNEVGRLSQLQHPSLLRYLGLVCEDKMCEYPPVLVMEMGTKGSLFEYLRSDNELSVKQQMRMASDLAGGLSHLHKNDVVHGDIKSLNVVLGDDLVAKWCDYGVWSLRDQAKDLMYMRKSASRTFRRGAASNTAWFSPELFEVKGSLFTTWSDMWAYGMLLFELVTREVPFADVHTDEEVRDSIRKWGDNCVPECCARGSPLSVFGRVMRRCWTHHSSFRPTAGEVELELEYVMSKMSDVEACQTK